MGGELTKSGVVVMRGGMEKMGGGEGARRMELK